jgi:hypothetical protein
MLMNPNYPIYIVSKGRWETRLTSKALEKLKVPYSIVIEPQEYDEYAAMIDPVKILVLPFSNLGQGSIPARNWIWDHALSIGSKRHWIMDDNIRTFNRLNRNLMVQVTSGSIFKAAEDFVDRYENVVIAGFNYDFFAKAKDPLPPFVLNTRIYSCLLIRNDIPYRWRGKYNEDTDLCLRVLKDGFCTIQFNAFLQEKATTQTMKGGNTDELYANGTLEKSQALVDLHPDVAKVVWKFNRWHHQVDYRKFKINKLIKKHDLVIPDRINNYGMKLMEIGL